MCTFRAYRRGEEACMLRVGSVWTAAAIACAVAGCGESRPMAAAIGAQGGCANCHSAPGEAPPFRDQNGVSDPRQITVGAHDAHLSGNLSPPIACGECHTVPRTVGDPGHLEDSPTDIRFGPLATTAGASPTYTAPSCATTYCHGNFPGGNETNTPRWIGAGPAQTCGACHGVAGDPMPSSGLHPQHRDKAFEGNPVTCSSCHGAVLTATHVNGAKDIAMEGWDPATRNCAAACHRNSQVPVRFWPAAQ
jgi:predicted CxxxxCH...CXXCH cytochrome family protein